MLVLSQDKHLCFIVMAINYREMNGVKPTDTDGVMTNAKV